MAFDFGALVKAASMMRVPKEQIITFGPWPLGLCTVMRPEQMSMAMMSAAQNLIYVTSTDMQTRRGTTLLGNGCTGSVKFNEDIRVNGTWYTIVADDDNKIYYNTAEPWVTGTVYVAGDKVIVSDVAYNCDTGHTAGTWATDLGAGKWSVSTNTVFLIAALSGEPYCLPFGDVMIICDRGSAKFWNGTYYNDRSYQFNNRSGTQSGTNALGHTNIRVATKFTSGAWDSGKTIPPTTFYATLQKEGNGFAGTDNVPITLRLRKVSDDSVLAVKTFLAAPIATALTTAAVEYSVTFTSGDITTEMSPNTDYYASLEYANGDAGNYVRVYYTTVASGGTRYVYPSGGPWAVSTVQKSVMALKPGWPGVNLLYDNGTDPTTSFQFNNRSGSVDGTNALGHTYDRVATKFTSQSWDAGYTIPPTTFYAMLSRTGQGYAEDIAAQGVIAMTGVATLAETFQIGTQTFTWVASRSGAGEVTQGASAAAAAANIITAVTADLATVTAVEGAVSSNVVITAATAGPAGNSIVFTESCTNMGMDGGGTLGGYTTGVSYTDATDIVAKLRLVADDSVLASKTFLSAPIEDALQLNLTDGTEYEITFTSSDIMTEMSPGTDYYMSLEYDNGDADNYVQVWYSSVASSGTRWAYPTGGPWAQSTTQRSIMGLKPGQPPKLEFALEHANRIHGIEGYDGTGPARLWHSGAGDSDNPGEFIWGTAAGTSAAAHGGGYDTIVDDSITNFPIGGIGVWYSQIWVTGSDRQKFLAKISGLNPAQYNAEVLQRTVSGHWKTLVATEDDLFFLDKGGITSAATIQGAGDLKTAYHSTYIHNLIEQYYTADTSFAGYEPERGLYLLKMPGYSKVIAIHSRIKADGVHSPATEWLFAMSGTVTAFGHGNGYMMIGASDGKFYKFDNSKTTDAGSALTYSLKTAAVRPGRGERELTEVSPNLLAPAAASAKLSFYIDHDHTTAIDSTTITIPSNMATTEFWDRVHGLNFNFRTLMLGIDTITLTGAEPLTITSVGIWHRALTGGV